MKTLRSLDRNFRYEFDKLLKRGDNVTKEIHREVDTILEEVRLRGDKAVQKYNEKFDEFHSEKFAVGKAEIKKAYKQISKEDLAALELAASRIENFHQKQNYESFETSKEGMKIGQIVRPLERVGVYVPGGKASYPSTVLMNAIPAKIAGVENITMATPFLKGECAPSVLVAADLAKVDSIYKMGGVQAIGAMAYGTHQVKKVDKIVGPGNTYVAYAKRLVYGEVDIDMIAGPSELLIIADQEAPPAWVAADLLSQAEHDEEAFTVLITFNSNYAHRVEGEIRKQLRALSRRKIAEASIKNRSFIIVAKNLKESIELANEFSPEHLELAIKEPKKALDQVKNAGAIFMGYHTPEACGDYLAGPSHVLPTTGNARFGSPLGVLDFLKTSSVIEFNAKALKSFSDPIIRLAEMEGLQAHAASVSIRSKDSK